MAQKGEKRHILVCGGGNGAQCLSAMVASHDEFEVNILTTFGDESARWKKACENHPMVLTIPKDSGEDEVRRGSPYLITNDPAKAMENVEIIFFVMPAFAHESYFRLLKPYVTDHTLIVGLPGQAGFEFQCRSILGDVAKKCVIMSFESLPFNTRIEEFGKEVHILGIKDSLGGALLVGSQSHLPFDPVNTVQHVFGETPKIELIKSYVAVTLMARSIVHPPIMYGKWKDWDKKPLDKKPLFYQGVDEVQANCLSNVSSEVVQTAKAIQEARKGEVDMSMVKHLYDGLVDSFHDKIGDHSSLLTTMRTNQAYDGLVHPMKEITEGQDKGKFLPDFKYRYLCEDVPYGLVVFKGIAQIANVPTPEMDKVITWAQGILGKEFLIGSELKGKDIGATRAPQAYNYSTLDDLLHI